MYPLSGFYPVCGRFLCPVLENRLLLLLLTAMVIAMFNFYGNVVFLNIQGYD